MQLLSSFARRQPFKAEEYLASHNRTNYYSVVSRTAFQPRFHSGILSHQVAENA